ncbi:MAG TPA: PHP domain-containing protein, partial [Polyangiales bacterium]
MSIALPAGADDATAPANPAIPAQPAPSEPAPTDSAPSEPAPTEPAPAQPPARRAIVREALHDVAVQRTPEPPGGHHFPKLERVEVGGVPYYPYSFDGHVHSEHSLDADHPVVELLAGAERVGLSAVVLTDHGSARSALSFDKYKGPVRAFVGQEIGGEYGHAVWWNVDATLPSNARRATLAERAAYAHERGGMIVLCHPGWWIGGRAQDPMTWVTPEALKKGGIS